MPADLGFRDSGNPGLESAASKGCQLSDSKRRSRCRFREAQSPGSLEESQGSEVNAACFEL